MILIFENSYQEDCDQQVCLEVELCCRVADLQLAFLHNKMQNFELL